MLQDLKAAQANDMTTLIAALAEHHAAAAEMQAEIWIAMATRTGVDVAQYGDDLELLNLADLGVSVSESSTFQAD